MTSIKVRRLASNPRKVTRRRVSNARPVRRAVARKTNPKRHVRRKLSAKQIKFFGTPGQKAALKRKRSRGAAPRKHKRRSNPVRRVVVAKRALPARASSRAVAARAAGVARRANPKRRRRNPPSARAISVRRKRKNPALVLTLGTVNPRRKAMKRRRRHTGVSRRRRSNPTRVVVRARSRKSNGRRHHRRSSRNPNVFGHSMSPTQTGMAIAGGLVGVTAAKLVAGMLPASLSSPIVKIGAALVTAIVSQGLGNKMKPGFGDAMMFGGLMQTGSLVLSAYLPSVGNQIGLNGMGDLVPGRFTIPQNPLRMPAPMMAPMLPPVAGVAGMRRAFPSAF